MKTRSVCLCILFALKGFVPAAEFEESNGMVVMEAEHASIIANWNEIEGVSGKAMQSRSKNKTTDYLQFNVHFTRAGNYYLWLFSARGENNHETNDTWIYLDDQLAYDPSGLRPDGIRNNTTYPAMSWSSLPKGPGAHTTAKKPLYVKVPVSGHHAFFVQARSDKFVVDKIVLKHESLPDAMTAPAGNGPAETLAEASQHEEKLPPGRFIWTSDGNDHDRDDILGSAVALSIIAAKKAQHKVPVFIYSDHIWETSNQEQEMIDTVNQTIALWGGFENMEIYNAYREELINKGVKNAAVQAIIREINKSSAADLLTIGSGGPRQIVIEAFKAADPSRLQYVTFVAHGTNTWNDMHAMKYHEGYSYDELLATGVNVIRIPDQNGHYKDGGGIYRFKYRFDEVDHWKHHTNACLNLLWNRGQHARKDSFDGSDAGIVWWYFMEHDQDGSFQKLEQLILK